MVEVEGQSKGAGHEVIKVAKNKTVAEEIIKVVRKEMTLKKTQHLYQDIIESIHEYKDA